MGSNAGEDKAGSVMQKSVRRQIPRLPCRNTRRLAGPPHDVEAASKASAHFIVRAEHNALPPRDAPRRDDFQA